jgi:aryl-alcohol dehydrogenase-like predicted oxidoreductase
MIPSKEFGRTGHLSTRVIFGAYALSEATQKEADAVLEILLEHGINHIDTAPIYGKSEERIGPWMEKHRDKFFLATKTQNRGCDRALKDLQRSMKRLRVDHIDLWQMHGLTNPKGWEKAMGPGGTLEAFIEEREKGLVRFLGVTGHGNKVPGMHIQSLERFDFDSVLLPYSCWQMVDTKYAADFETLAGMCRDRKAALQTIKSVARRKWEDRPKTHNTYFYQPLETQGAVDKTVHWVLGNPQVFLITAGDIQILPKVLDAAERFEARPPDVEMDALIEEMYIQPIFS